MSKFDFVLILVSFAFSLALGQLLTRVGSLVLARARVRFSGLLALAILNALAQVYVDWLSLWDYRDLKTWDLFKISVFFAYSTIVFFICTAAAPETPADQQIDLEAFFWQTRRLYYALFILLMLTFMAGAWILLDTPTPALALQQCLSNLPFLFAALLGFLVRARWAQWIAGISLLVLSATWPIVFSAALQ